MRLSSNASFWLSPWVPLVEAYVSRLAHGRLRCELGCPIWGFRAAVSTTFYRLFWFTLTNFSWMWRSKHMLGGHSKRNQPTSYWKGGSRSKMVDWSIISPGEHKTFSFYKSHSKQAQPSQLTFYLTQAQKLNISNQWQAGVYLSL